MIDLYNLMLQEFLAAAMKTVSEEDLNNVAPGAVPAGLTSITLVGDGRVYLSPELKALRFIMERESNKRRKAQEDFRAAVIHPSRYANGQTLLQQRHFCETLRLVYEACFRHQYREHLYDRTFAGYDHQFRIWTSGLKSPNDAFMVSVSMGSAIVL